MRKYVQERSQSTMQLAIPVGTVVHIKVDKVDWGKLDCKSVPGINCEIMEPGNHRIVCKGGALKDCLKQHKFQVNIKKAELWPLGSDAWQTMHHHIITFPCIRHQVQSQWWEVEDSSFATAKGVVREKVAKTGRMVSSATVIVTHQKGNLWIRAGLS